MILMIFLKITCYEISAELKYSCPNFFLSAEFSFTFGLLLLALLKYLLSPCQKDGEQLILIIAQE